jgi:hypothetical protein
MDSFNVMPLVFGLLAVVFATGVVRALLPIIRQPPPEAAALPRASGEPAPAIPALSRPYAPAPPAPPRASGALSAPVWVGLAILVVGDLLRGRGRTRR